MGFLRLTQMVGVGRIAVGHNHEGNLTQCGQQSDGGDWLVRQD